MQSFCKHALSRLKIPGPGLALDAEEAAQHCLRFLLVEQQECAPSCGHLQKVIKTPGSKGVFLLLHPSNIKLVLVLFSMYSATLIRHEAAWQVFPSASRLVIAVCSRA